MMMMDDDGDEQLFTFFIQWHSEGSRMTQYYFLALLLLFELCLLLAYFASKQMDLKNFAPKLWA
jgi:hypothetical protein